MAAFVSALAVVLVWRFALLLGATVFEGGGLPYDAARFQAASALTGSGFTTAESDLVVRNPAARRVAQFLFVLGYVGPASVLTLLGFGLFLPNGEPASVKVATAVILVAVLVVAIKVDPAVRAQTSVARWLGRRINGNRRPTLWVIAPGMAIAAAFLPDGDTAVGQSLEDWVAPGVEALAVGSLIDEQEHWIDRPDPTHVLRAHDRVLLYGDDETLRSMTA